MPDARDKAMEAVIGVGEGFNAVGEALETVALLGMLCLGYQWWCDLIYLKKMGEVKKDLKSEMAKEAFTCGDCNKKAVCPTCTQKVCVICKEKPCSS